MAIVPSLLGLDEPLLRLGKLAAYCQGGCGLWGGHGCDLAVGHRPSSLMVVSVSIQVILTRHSESNSTFFSIGTKKQ
jgi:hypothetical protein